LQSICKKKQFTQISQVARRGQVGACSEMQVLGAHQHTSNSNLNTHFKQQFRPKCAKNAYFLKKKLQKSPQCRLRTMFASGDWRLRPQTPALLLSPTTSLLGSFLSLNTFYYPPKMNK